MTDDVAATLRALVARLEELGIAYMVVGSLAALAHGRARSTLDVDVVVDVDAEGAARLAASFPADRFYASITAATDAVVLGSMFNVIDMQTGWKLDLVPLKRRPFSQTEFARRRRIELFGLDVFVASIEDTIISKLEWSRRAGGSERQREDVRELLAFARDLDDAYVQKWVTQLGLEDEWTAVTA